MSSRLVGRSLVLSLAAFFACVGDAPESSQTGPTADASANAEAAPPITDDPTPKAVVSVTPVTLVRGSSILVEVDAFVENATGPLVVTLGGLPLGFESPVAGQPLEGTHARIPLEVKADASYGDATVQVNVSTRAGEVLGSAPLGVFVRGAPGALDTSFGSDGRAQEPVDGVLGGVLLADDGSLYAVGASHDAAPRTIVAHYTDTGRLDPSFGTAGEHRFAPPGLTSTLPYRRGSWHDSLRQDGNTLTFAGAYAPAVDAAEAQVVLVQVQLPLPGAQPIFGPVPVSPAPCGFVQGAIPDGNAMIGMLWQTAFSSRIRRCNVDGTLDLAWGNSGLVDPSNESGVPHRLYDVVATADRIFLFGAVGKGNDPPGRYGTILNRQNGSVVRKAPIPALYSLSRPAADGTVLAGYAPAEGQPRGVCVRRFDKDGAETAVVGTVVVGSCFGNAQKANGFGGRPFYRQDGSAGIVDYSEPGALHLADATGSPLSVANGIVLERAEVQAEQALVDVFEDKRGRLVLVYASSYASEPGGEPATSWKIRRFWL